MSWRESRSRSWAEDNGYGDSSDGVSVELVMGKIPMVSMEKASAFDENVSWMLQSAMGISGKADAVYDHYHDERIMAECRRLGYREDEVALVRCKDKEYRHISAIGTSGKRSVMMAVVVALALDNMDGLDEFWSDLRQYKLHRQFDALIRLITNGASDSWYGESSNGGNRGGNSGGSSWQSNRAAADEAEAAGVEVQVVRGNVPVIIMEKGSVLDEHASTLLQLVAGSTSKATSLYDYAFDEDVMRQLRSLNLTDQDVMIARMTGSKFKDCLAVGASGKRSVMLALVVSVIMNHAKPVDEFLEDVRGYDQSLEGACEALCSIALGTSFSGGRSSNRSGQTYGKRKSSSLSSFDKERGGKKKPSRGSRYAKDTGDVGDLDAQLEGYFAESD